VRLYFPAALVLMAAACSDAPKQPSPPSVDGAEPISVNLTEKLGWDQPAADFSDLSNIAYEIYVDGTPSRLEGVECSDAPSAAGFGCKAPLPRMSLGPHSLELSSFYLSNPDAKSARAGPLNINVRSLVAGDVLSSRAAAAARPGAAAARQKRVERADAEDVWPRGVTVAARGLDRAADLAFTPDDRLLIAERGGRIRVFRDGRLLDEPALVLPARTSGEGAIVSIAIDPAFARNGYVYAIYTERARSGALSFTLARFREARETLADAIVILDDIRASIDARAVVRFGPDGKLYAAFDDGGDDRAATDPGSFNGKILRINADGTTPDDAPQLSPVLLAGISSPRGISWHGPNRHLWVATDTHVDAIRWPGSPTALAGARDDLYVGSDTGLVRAQLDPGTRRRVVQTDTVFNGLGVRAVAIRGDGAVFFASDDSIGVVEH